MDFSFSITIEYLHFININWTLTFHAFIYLFNKFVEHCCSPDTVVGAEVSGVNILNKKIPRQGASILFKDRDSGLDALF